MRLAFRAFLALALVFSSAHAQAPADDPVAAFIASLDYRQGDVPLPEAHATLRLGDGFRFLGKRDARRVLEELWGNPEDDQVLGLLVPVADDLDSEHSWAVVLTWLDDGHVMDADAASIDYDDLLADMQAQVRSESVELAKAGYPSAELLGWAQPPRYDAQAKRLHWAKRLRFSGAGGDTLNYDIRVLGRQGVLSMNAVAGMRDIERVNAGMADVLQMAAFDDGHRYADYDEDSDRLAAYGLAALVGGGIASKTGLLAKLGLLLAKGWKLLVFAGIGIAGLLGKRRKDKVVS